MKKSLRKLVSLILILGMVISLIPLSSSDSLAATGKNIIVYFPNWGTYNPAHKNMTVGMVPWDKITVINHAFFEIDSSFKLASTDSFADFDKVFDHSGGWNPGDLRGHIGEYKYYKTLYPNVNVMISVGGWTRGQNFHAMATSSSSRAIFIQSIVDFLKQYPFINGIDLDWEYPGINRVPDPNDSFDRGCPGGPEDKQNFTSLLREIRAAYNSNGLSDKLLTIAAPAGYDKLELQEPAIYAQYLDWLNVMTYDLHGAWENTTNHHSGIYANPNDPSPTSPIDIKNNYNTDYAMKNLSNTYNIPKSKLNVGSPFYSRGWKGVTGGTNGMYSNATGSTTGSWDNVQSPGGQYPYSDLKNMENANGYVKYRDTSYAKTPWLYNSSLGITLSYEDDVSIGSRCDYINSNGFGGLIIWEISGDDANFTLTNTAYNKLIGNNPTVSTPTFTPGGGTYSSAQSVALSCSTSGATIRYTLNGSEPTSSSTIYSNPITVSATTTIKAKAFKSGMSDSSIAVATYTIGTLIETVSEPVFTPSAGSYSAAQNVTLSCATASATIRYTLDGSEPTATSSQYIGAIYVASTTILKAKAFKSGMNNSTTLSATYTIDNGQAVTDSGTPNGAPPVASLTTNNYDGNANYTISFNIWWGNNATSYKVYENNSIVLSGPLNANSPNAQTATFNISNKANGTYIYKIDLTNAFGTTVSNTISINVTKGGTIETVSTPVFSPAGGTYPTSQSVTLTCGTSGATIRYTQNGSEPTSSSTVYSSPISVPVTTTIKAKAFKADLTDSNTASVTYTISSGMPAYKVIGYVYGIPGNIDATKLTHINYAFGSIVNGQISANSTDLATLVALKSNNSNLKVLLSVGGWGADGFSDAALTDSSRTTFANSCLQVINNNNLDGIDLDWEYPVNGGWGIITCRPEDKQNFTLLLQKIRNTIGATKLLTIAGGAGTEFVNNTELSQIANICDYINIMTYDFGASTHNSNLYNTSTYSSGISSDSAVLSYISAGVPASKINMGVPFYGRYGINWPTYSELKATYINQNGWIRNWDNQAKACYLTKNGEFITYDDIETFGYKTAYIKQMTLGGVMFWQYSQDPSGELLNKLWSDLNGGIINQVATPT